MQSAIFASLALALVSAQDMVFSTNDWYTRVPVSYRCLLDYMPDFDVANLASNPDRFISALERRPATYYAGLVGLTTGCAFENAAEATPAASEAAATSAAAESPVTTSEAAAATTAAESSPDAAAPATTEATPTATGTAAPEETGEHDHDHDHESEGASHTHAAEETGATEPAAESAAETTGAAESAPAAESATESSIAQANGGQTLAVGAGAILAAAVALL